MSVFYRGAENASYSDITTLPNVPIWGTVYVDSDSTVQGVTGTTNQVLQATTDGAPLYSFVSQANCSVAGGLGVGSSPNFTTVKFFTSGGQNPYVAQNQLALVNANYELASIPSATGFLKGGSPPTFSAFALTDIPSGSGYLKGSNTSPVYTASIPLGDIQSGTGYLKASNGPPSYTATIALADIQSGTGYLKASNGAPSYTPSIALADIETGTGYLKASNGAPAYAASIPVADIANGNGFLKGGATVPEYKYIELADLPRGAQDYALVGTGSLSAPIYKSIVTTVQGTSGQITPITASVGAIQLALANPCTTPGSLNVSSDLTITGQVLQNLRSAGRILLADGAFGAPSLSFTRTALSTWGFYVDASNTVSFSAGGQCVRFTGSPSSSAAMEVSGLYVKQLSIGNANATIDGRLVVSNVSNVLPAVDATGSIQASVNFLARTPTSGSVWPQSGPWLTCTQNTFVNSGPWLLGHIVITPATTATIQFGSIPGVFKHLKLVINAAVAVASSMYIRFGYGSPVTISNGAQHYTWNFVYSQTGVASAGFTDDTGILIGNIGTTAMGSACEVLIPNYTSTSLHKGVISTACYAGNGVSTTMTTGGVWYSGGTKTAPLTAKAINTINIYAPAAGGATWQVGSMFSLYGLN